MDKNALTAAAICGLLVGIIGAIPFFDLANVCCCLWGWLGAFLAVRLYSRVSGQACSAKRGIVIGLLTGLIGGIVWPFAFIGVNIVRGDILASQFQNTTKNFDFKPLLANIAPEQRDNVLKRMQNFTTMPPRQALYELTSIIAPFFLVVLTAMCTLAGLVGSLLFSSDVGPDEAVEAGASS